jgi:hypothetical protein
MKPKKNDRLRLSRESLRPLDNASLDRVRGGVLSYDPSGDTKMCDTGGGGTGNARWE